MRSLLPWLGVLCVCATSGTARAAPVDFQREIRPILADHCFTCHGPDEAARKGKLRLDIRADALLGGRSSEPAIVPGKPEGSEAIRRLLSEDAARVMPPAKSGKKLTPKQVDLLRRWIAEGAEYRPHWAFVAPRRPELPAVRPAGSRNPIDLFVRARLEAEGLQPAPRADTPTLIRRLYLDLIGIPPTPEQADRDALRPVEAVVDDLLANPHYGERWARRWLDLARYADTNGYEKDRPRSIWPYRDWVIAALNADMPFDRFTIEQLAGDMLPDATQDQRIATGFHRNTMLNEEGGIDPQEFRFHALTDRVATTATVWLGLTLGCAQCHAHKYDPISHREYYGMFAFLNNADEPELSVQHAESSGRRRAILEKISAAEANLVKSFPGDSDAAFAGWLRDERKRALVWRIHKPVEATANGPRLTTLPDASVRASGDVTKRDVYTLKLAGDFSGATAIRLEALPDETLPRGGPGRTFYEGPHGEFHLSEIAARSDGTPVKFVRAEQTFANGKFTASMAIDGDPQTGWGINGGQGKRHVAVFVLDKPLGPTRELQIEMVFERYYAAALGRFRLSTTTADRPTASDIPAEIEPLLLRPEATLTAEDRRLLRGRFFATTPLLAKARQEIDTLRKQLPVEPTTLVLRERPADHPRPTFLHHRGEFLQPKERIEPTTLAVLPAFPVDAPRNRLGFARWLVSPDNPLTARVAVNRQWAAFFGRGLVKTTEDFGLQGDLPTHPELLDWLSVEFMANRWSLKHLHRLIVLSATYQQASRVTPELREKDPENRLLARGPRVRLEGEQIRDSVLLASGLLTETIGGPSVFPPQPANVTTEGTYGALAWNPSQGADRYRRGLYTFAKRTAPFAMFATFDGPSGEACVPRREVSNTPLQALTLLNDVVFTEAARAAGRLALAHGGTTETRVRFLFRRFLIRPPTEGEIQALEGFVKTQQERFARSPEQAKLLAGDARGDTAEAAAWTALARVLCNLDEFVTRN